jgi:hypothetical protein
VSGAVERRSRRRLSGRLGRLQVSLVVLTAVLVFLVALGSRRSFARLGPGRSLLDVRPALGDLFVVLVAVLAVELGVVLYLLFRSFRRPVIGAERGRDRSSPWQRLVATLVPLVLIAALIGAIARRDQNSLATPSSLPMTPGPLPFDGPQGTGTPLVVHWAVLGPIAAAGVVIAVGLLLLRRWRRRRDLRRSAVAVPTDREELRTAVDASLRELEDDPDPRRAVINAYAGMEQVLARHGLPRRAAEAPLEYLARWVGVLGIGRTAAQGLAVLYERARFSLHVIDEEMRQEARAALGALRRDLGDEHP